MARILSSGLMLEATTGLGAGRGAAVVAAAAGAAAAERAAAAGAAELRKGGAPGTGGAGAAMGAALDAPVGPPGGNVGSLMVGAAVGLGGRLIRTVSFLGCTRPVDFFIGSAPVGAPGLIGGISAINLILKIRFARRLSNLILKEKPGWAADTRPVQEIFSGSPMFFPRSIHGGHRRGAVRQRRLNTHHGGNWDPA